MREVEIKKATLCQLENVINGLDSILSKEGFGFVNKMQIKTEIARGTVFIAYLDNKEVGFRIGKNRLWNIAVHPKYRGMGIGKALLLYYKPAIIRVKNKPIGHLSKQQRNDFTDPTPFYEAMGYKKITEDYGRNFWAGGNKKNIEQKRIFSKQGKIKHISIYIDESAFLFSADAMADQWGCKFE